MGPLIPDDGPRGQWIAPHMLCADDHRQWLMKAASESWFSSSDAKEWTQDNPAA